MPQLETVVSRDATAFIPKGTDAAVGFEARDDAFGSGEAAALAFVIVEGTEPLDEADLAWYGGLAERLRAGEQHVADVQDAVSTPSLDAALVSPDREVAYLPVAVRHPVGSPEAAEDIAFLRAEAAQPPGGLTASVTGDPATLVDIRRPHPGRHRTERPDHRRPARADLPPREGLLALEEVAEGFARVDGVEAVRGVTLPRGERLEQAQLPSQLGVPVLSFVLLVAVGVDRNILLVTRIREEAPAAERAGIARAVATTGAVITAAGVIFAGSFLAMLFTGIDAMAQNGFAIAAGLLLDTFLVRALLVPAIATLLGRYTWWPGERLGRAWSLRAVPALVQQGLRSAARQVRGTA